MVIRVDKFVCRAVHLSELTEELEVSHLTFTSIFLYVRCIEHMIYLISIKITGSSRGIDLKITIFRIFCFCFRKEVILPIICRVIGFSLFTYCLLYWFESASNCVLIIYFDLHFAKIVS